MLRFPKHIKKMSLLATFSLVLGQTAFAECLQGEARYVDPESGLLLSFSSLGENVQVMHQFTVAVESSETSLNGFVIADGEPLRPVSYVLNQCPDGDVTGEELEACTVWKGVPYGRYQDSDIGLLPLPSEAAVAQVLLPDFARSIVGNSVWQEFEIAAEPFEVFDFKDCGAEK